MMTMRTRAALLLGGLAAACAPAGRAPLPEPFRPCPGQEAAMAELGRRPHPRGDARRTVVAISVATVEVTSPADLDTAVLAARAQASRGKTRAISAEVQLRVDSAGRVSDARLLQGTGDADVDQYLVQNAYTLRFDPAAERAFPVPGCAIQTIPVELPA